VRRWVDNLSKESEGGGGEGVQGGGGSPNPHCVSKIIYCSSPSRMQKEIKGNCPVGTPEDIHSSGKKWQAERNGTGRFNIKEKTKIDLNLLEPQKNRGGIWHLFHRQTNNKKEEGGREQGEGPKREVFW